ncbi:MAG: hypothetical protein ACLP8S_05650 [Solirubrobacteraceae bacterium]
MVRHLAGRRLTAALAGLLLAASTALAPTALGWTVGAVLQPAPAAADGDPASDTLLVQNVFYPYSPPTSTALQRLLNGATAAAAKERTPVKVALIASPVDLGTVAVLFGKPQEYADFLDQEISYNSKQPLLVVMSDGYGSQGLTRAANAAVAALPTPAGGTSNQLGGAALRAVDRIAVANGHPLVDVAPSTAAAGGGDGTPVLIIGALAAVALAATAGLATVTLRRRT